MHSFVFSNDGKENRSRSSRGRRRQVAAREDVSCWRVRGKSIRAADSINSISEMENKWMNFLWYTGQRSVWLETQSVTFDIENINNNCCETNICKNDICLLFTNLQIHFWLLCGLDVRIWIGKFVIINKWHFLKLLFQNNYCSYFQNN